MSPYPAWLPKTPKYQTGWDNAVAAGKDSATIESVLKPRIIEQYNQAIQKYEPAKVASTMGIDLAALGIQPPTDEFAISPDIAAPGALAAGRPPVAVAPPPVELPAQPPAFDVTGEQLAPLPTAAPPATTAVPTEPTEETLREQVAGTISPGPEGDTLVQNLKKVADLPKMAVESQLEEDSITQIQIAKIKEAWDEGDKQAIVSEGVYKIMQAGGGIEEIDKFKEQYDLFSKGEVLNRRARAEYEALDAKYDLLNRQVESRIGDFKIRASVLKKVKDRERYNQMVAQFNADVRDFNKGLDNRRAATKVEISALEKKYGRLQEDVEGKDDNFFEQMLTGTSNMLPMMLRGIHEGQKTGAAAAGTAALVTAIAGVAGPQAILPEEAVTIPITAGVAYGVGTTVGSTEYWRKQGAAETYESLLRKGVDRDVARNISLVAGIPYALLERFQVSRFARLIPKNLQNKIRQSLVANITKAVGRHGILIGQETLVEGLQKVITSTAEEIGQYAEEIKTSEDVKESVKKISTEFVQEMKDVLPAMVGMTIPAGIGGGTAAFRETFDAKALKQSVDKFNKKQRDIAAKFPEFEMREARIEGDRVVLEGVPEVEKVKTITPEGEVRAEPLTPEMAARFAELEGRPVPVTEPPIAPPAEPPAGPPPAPPVEPTPEAEIGIEAGTESLEQAGIESKEDFQKLDPDEQDRIWTDLNEEARSALVEPSEEEKAPAREKKPAEAPMVYRPKTGENRDAKRVTLETLADEHKADDPTLTDDQAMRAADLGGRHTISRLPSNSHHNSELDRIRANPVEGNVLIQYAMDLNYFKRIDDTYGHVMGDEIMVGNQQDINDKVDKLGGNHYHFGGDEGGGVFYVPRAEVSRMLKGLAQIKRGHNKDHQIESPKTGKPLPIGISMAVAEGFDFANADNLLTASKQAGNPAFIGRNGIKFDEALKKEYNIKDTKGPDYKALYDREGLVVGREEVPLAEKPAVPVERPEVEPRPVEEEKPAAPRVPPAKPKPAEVVPEEAPPEVEEFRFDPNSTKNEGRWRLARPLTKEEQLRTFRRKSKTPGVSYVIQISKAEPKKEIIQAIRFSKSIMPESKAAAWWDKNKARFKKEWTAADWEALAKPERPPSVEPGDIKSADDFIAEVKKNINIETGGLRRGLEYFIGLTENLSEADIEKAIEWARGQGKFIHRFLGGDLDSELRKRQKAPAKPKVEKRFDLATESPTAADVDTDPTEAQKEAENYKVAQATFAGFELTIENPAGTVRKGKDPDTGKVLWTTTMKAHYGRVLGTVGYDKDHVDAFVKPKGDADAPIFVVNQVDPKTRKFDEHKIMMGYATVDEAKAAYLAHYEKGWKGYHSISQLSQEAFKDWVYDKTKFGPAGGFLTAGKVKMVEARAAKKLKRPPISEMTVQQLEARIDEIKAQKITLAGEREMAAIFLELKQRKVKPKAPPKPKPPKKVVKKPAPPAPPPPMPADIKRLVNQVTAFNRMISKERDPAVAAKARERVQALVEILRTRGYNFAGVPLSEKEATRIRKEQIKQREKKIIDVDEQSAQPIREMAARMRNANPASVLDYDSGIVDAVGKGLRNAKIKQFFNLTDDEFDAARKQNWGLVSRLGIDKIAQEILGQHPEVGLDVDEFIEATLDYIRTGKSEEFFVRKAKEEAEREMRLDEHAATVEGQLPSGWKADDKTNNRFSTNPEGIEINVNINVPDKRDNIFVKTQDGRTLKIIEKPTPMEIFEFNLDYRDENNKKLDFTKNAANEFNDIIFGNDVNYFFNMFDDKSLLGKAKEAADAEARKRDKLHYTPGAKPAKTETQKVNALVNRIRETSATGNIPLDTIRAVAMPSEAKRVLEIVREVLPITDVVFVEVKEGGPAFEGLVHEGTIFINTKAKEPISWTLLHEGAHSAAQKYPDVYSYLVDYLVGQLTHRGVHAVKVRSIAEAQGVHVQTLLKELRAIKEVDLQSEIDKRYTALNTKQKAAGFNEIVADFYADELMNPKFLRYLDSKNHNLFRNFIQEIAKYISEVFETLSKKLSKTHTMTDWFKDIDETRTMMAGFLETSKMMQDKEATAKQVDMIPFSRKDDLYQTNAFSEQEPENRLLTDQPSQNKKREEKVPLEQLDMFGGESRTKVAIERLKREEAEKQAVEDRGVVGLPLFDKSVQEEMRARQETLFSRAEKADKRIYSTGFKNWFGDWENEPKRASKIVNKDGSPMVVYHGTPNASFSEFREEAHFTENPDYASIYTSPSAAGGPIEKRGLAPSIYPVYLSIKKPFDTRKAAHARLYEEFTNTFGNRTPLSERKLPDWTDSINILEWMEETNQPFDGMILDEGGVPLPDGTIKWRGLSYVPRSPEQIKSVIANTGEFSTEDPDIRFSRSEQKADNILLSQHNISPEKIRNALKKYEGNLLVPSVAIRRLQDEFEGYGDISLISGSDLIDPRKNRYSKIFLADGYTSKFPQIEKVPDYEATRTFTTDAMKAVKEVFGKMKLKGVFADEYRNIIESSYPEARIRDVIRDNNMTHVRAELMFLAKFIRDNKIKITKEADMYSPASLGSWINKKHGSAYDMFVSDQMDEMTDKERIFKGFTYSGNRKYIPATIQNIVREMKRELAGGETAQILYGVGQIRAGVAPRLKNLKAIREAGAKLVAPKEFEGLKKEADQQFFALSEALSPHYKHIKTANQFGILDIVAEAIIDVYRGGMEWGLRENLFENVPEDVQTMITDFRKYLESMPTEYMESKITRAVDISEFKYAVIPTYLEQKIVDALTKKGLKVVKYNRKVEGGRQKRIEKLTTEYDDILFSISPLESGQTLDWPMPSTTATIMGEWFKRLDQMNPGMKQNVHMHIGGEIKGYRFAASEAAGVFIDDQGRAHITINPNIQKDYVADTILEETIGHYGAWTVFKHEPRIRNQLKAIFIQDQDSDLVKKLRTDYADVYKRIKSEYGQEAAEDMIIDEWIARHMGTIVDAFDKEVAEQNRQEDMVNRYPGRNQKVYNKLDAIFNAMDTIVVDIPKKIVKALMEAIRRFLVRFRIIGRNPTARANEILYDVFKAIRTGNYQFSTTKLMQWNRMVGIPPGEAIARPGVAEPEYNFPRFATRFTGQDMPKNFDKDLEEVSVAADSENEVNVAKKNVGPVPGFDSEEAEKRWKQSRGFKRQPFNQKWSEIVETLKGMTRHFPLLKSERFGQIIDILRQYEAVPSYSKVAATNVLKGITANMTEEHYDAFTRLLILPDIVKDVDRGLYDVEDPDTGEIKLRDLPFGFKTKDQIEREIAKLNEYATKNPLISKAVETRNRFMNNLKRELVYHGLLHEKVMQYDDYFHHQVLEVIEEQDFKGMGLRSEDASLKKKGFQRKRKGSSRDFNTEYVEAEFEVLAQAIAQLENVRTLKKIKHTEDIADRLKLEAKDANFSAVMKKYEGKVDANGKPIDPFKPFKQRIAMAMSGLDKIREDGGFDGNEYDRFSDVIDTLDVGPGETGPDNRFFKFLSYLLDNELDGAMQAATIFKAIRDRNQFIKDTLGNRFKTWEDLIPDGYVTWQPEKGTHFHQILTVSEKLAEAVMKGEKTINEGDVKKALAIGQKYKEWVIPEELARTLDHFARVRETTPGVFFRHLQSTWKQWVLINPLRVLKYNINNTSGDVDIAMAYDPKILLRAPRAAKDLRGYSILGQRASADILTLIKKGVIDSGMSIYEIPEISEQGFFKLMSARDPNLIQKIWGKTGQKVWEWSRAFTNWRENILRLAAYRYFKDKLARNPNLKIYGASKKVEIDQISNIDDKAAKLARELIGDYGNISHAGQWLREKLIPFYSWMEINAPRYYRLFKNMPEEGRKRTSVGRIVSAKTARNMATLAAKASFLYIIVNLYNRILWPDEEEELGENRRQLHVILGRRKDGTIRTLRFQGAVSDALSWAGLEDLPSDVRDLVSERLTFVEKLEEMGKAPVSKMANALTPYGKVVGEIIVGETIYPDMFRPRPIRDKFEHLARMWSAERIYRTVRGRPTKGFADNLEAVLFYSTDPGEAAYWDSRKLVFQFLDRRGDERPSGKPTSRANVLYYYKQALRFGDESAAQRYYRQYAEMGGTRAGMENSIKRAHPLAPAPVKLRGSYLKTLNPKDRKKLSQAYKWYKDVFLRRSKIENLYD